MIKKYLPGIAILAIVGFIYTLHVMSGTWPPGHPWSGISLTMLGLMMLSLPHGKRGKLGWLAMILGLTASILWLASALLSLKSSQALH